MFVLWRRSRRPRARADPRWRAYSRLDVVENQPIEFTVEATTIEVRIAASA